MPRLHCLLCLAFLSALLACDAGAGVYLSSYTFSAADLPTIWTDEELPEPYRLRAKIGGSHHATDIWNNNQTQLQSVPGTGTFTVELYWVLYDTEGGAVLEVGPFATHSLTVLSANLPPQTHWVRATDGSPGGGIQITGRATDPDHNLDQLLFFTITPEWDAWIVADSAAATNGSDTTSTVAWEIPASHPPGNYLAHLRAFDSANAEDWNGGVISEFFVRLAQPAVSSQNATLALGAAFTPQYSGGAGTGFWQFVVTDQTNWGGATTGTLLPPSFTPSATWTPDRAGTFQFFVIKQGDAQYDRSAIAGPYTLTVQGSPPVISSHPQSAAATVGQSVALAVTVTDASPVTYQWSKDGGILAGANSATLSFSSVQLADSGTYTVRVSNPAGSVSSNPATLSVRLLAPLINAHPASLTVPAGQTGMFAVTATGSPPLTYQWRKDGGNLPGATHASLAITSAQGSDNGSYSVEVSNAAGTAISNAATLVVVLVAPSLSAQPVSQTAYTGQVVTLAVTATGSAPLSYQWRKDGATIVGATQRTLTFPSVQAADAATSPGYSVSVSNQVGTVTSSPATLTVTTTPPIRLALQYWQAGDWPNFETGGHFESVWVYFTSEPVEFDSEGNPISWVERWDPHTENVWVPDLAADGRFGSRWDTTSGTFGNPETSAAGAYVATANHRGFLLNDYLVASLLTFRAWAHAPANNCQTFTVSVFYPSQELLSRSTFAAGAPVLSQALLWQTGLYRIEIAYSGATATAEPTGAVNYYVAVGVPPPPVFQTHPQPAQQSISAGNTVTFTALATGTPLYQWQKDGQALPGATADTLTLAQVTESASGTYRVSASNSSGSVLSAPTTLLVTPNPLADSDGDGIPNGIEQLLATNPQSAATSDTANTVVRLRIYQP